MPNIKSAKKRVQVSGVRNERNKADKSALKTALKKFEAAAAEGNRTEAESAYKVAVKSVLALLPGKGNILSRERISPFVRTPAARRD